MNLIIDNEIFQWLLKINSIKNSEKIKTKDKKTMLNENSTNNFITGKKFIEIYKNLKPILYNNLNVNEKNLDRIRESKKKLSLLNNWNILGELFGNININLSNELKELICNGDLDMINEFLKEIYVKSSLKLEKLISNSTNVI